MTEKLFDIPELVVDDLDDPVGDSSDLYVPEHWQAEVTSDTNKPLEIKINPERVESVLSTLLTAYEERQYPYNLDRVRLPHDPRHMPARLERGGKEHAMFLWTTCYYMRGGIKSVDAFKGLSRLYDEQPELFDCEVAATVEQEYLSQQLKRHGLGFQKTVARHWVENAPRMQERYGGDPRNIFESIDTYEEALAVIRNDQRGNGFYGFQEKMTSMIIYYLSDEELIEPFVFPIPTDIHVMRVSIANKLIEFPGSPKGTNLYADEVLSTLRQLYFDYAERHGVNPLHLCDSVWLLSAALCGRTPGNRTLEPLGRKNRNGRSTVLIPQPIDPSDAGQRADYHNTCGRCPIENTCELLIPGKIYYVSGALIIRGERIKLPPPYQSKLFEHDLTSEW